MKNNRLAIEALREELESIKANSKIKKPGKSKSTKIVEPVLLPNNPVTPAVGGNNQPHGGNTTNAARGGIGHDIKNSYINNLYMKSGALMLYIITGILGYAHKIPFVRKILFGLSLWYGRSTWYQIIVKILRIARKTLVYINAAIGVYVVFKTVGFSSDNLAVGIAMMGGEYYMILTNFVKNLFNWFVELFDYKLIPNIPDNPPSKPNLPKWNIPTNFS